MAPPPRGVLFGPIVDWGKGSSKVLLEFSDEEEVRRTRQYVLEEVAKWHLVPGFGEDGSRALMEACANTEKCKSEWQGERDWDLYISQQERQGRGDEEILRVRDGPLAERAIEILKMGMAIQDSSVNGHLEGFDFTYEQAEVEDNMLESITVRLIRPDGSVLDGMTHRWTLSTLRQARRTRMAGIQEEVEESGSEDERRKKRNVRLGKKPRLEGGLTLGELDREYSKGLETARVRTFEEVRSNVFRMSSPGEEKDVTMEDSLPIPTRAKKMPGLKDSRHAVIDLTEEEEEGKEKEHEEKGVDIDMEESMGASTGASPARNRSWKPIWDSREAMMIIYSIKYIDGNEAGGGGWKAISKEAIAKGDYQHIEWIMEAERTWRTVSQVKSSQLAGVERELAEVKKQLTLLAVSLVTGTPEQVAEAKRTINTRRGKVEEEKRKQEELKKVEKKRREEEASRKQEEANKKSQEKAREACEATIRDLVGKVRPDLSSGEMIELGQKMKEAEEMKKRIEEEAAAPIERLVDRTVQVIGTEVFKVTRVVMGHMQPLDTKGRAELESAAGKVNNLLRAKGLANEQAPWQVTGKAGRGEFCDESTWEVRRVRKEVDPAEVAREVGMALASVFESSGDMLNVWVEEARSVKLIVPSAPMVIPKGRKELAEKIKGENKGLRIASRYPKLWGTTRVTGFTFDVVDDQEAKKVIKEGLMWEGKRRRVSYLEQGRGPPGVVGASGRRTIPGWGSAAAKVIRVAYQNVGGSHLNTHVFLEWCKEEGVDVAFVGETWIDKGGKGSQSHPSFQLRSGVRKGRRVFVYWRRSLAGSIKVETEEDNLVIVEVFGRKLGGVYANGKLQGQKWEEWLGEVSRRLDGGNVAVVGDWNAHSHDWDEASEEDSRGRSMAAWILGLGLTVAEGDCGRTWERMRRGRVVSSRIDLFLSKGEKEWGGVRREKILSDHWALLADIDWGGPRQVIEKEAVDWKGLEDEMATLQEGGLEAEIREVKEMVGSGAVDPVEYNKEEQERTLGGWTYSGGTGKKIESGKGKAPGDD
ncbi:hypothetical protein L211DRAFT_884786 [Terfezia boudieri ATCC MYA-4762]|uniref:Endonuclease/exonuclease/phosphatase domain-containing protein n=1 Tax=Terfezia boudieri ATCC MYA-4762 TaxID=1051890 RepID=A0A3N4LWS4_9PEZI|nr:hypothetical protein L211DRAFT_884786 [Terfezia boudieri ATCC MYA-4762]